MIGYTTNFGPIYLELLFDIDNSDTDEIIKEIQKKFDKEKELQEYLSSHFMPEKEREWLQLRYVKDMNKHNRIENLKRRLRLCGVQEDILEETAKYLDEYVIVGVR